MAVSHKLGDNSLSLRRTFAYNCLRLALMSVVVAMSVTKVVIGAELVHACPLEPVLPVYVVVSGCLTVFLSAIRDPYDRPKSSEEGKRSGSSNYTFMTGIATLGIILNMAWLVAGSAWVYSTWTNVRIQNNFCQYQSNNVTHQYHDHQNTSVMSNGTSSRIPTQSYVISNNNVSLQPEGAAQNVTAISNSEARYGIGNAAYSIASAVNASKVIDQVNVTDTTTCKSCDRTLLVFASVCVTTDWTCVVVGLAYLCYRCCKIGLWIKGECKDIIYKSV